MGVFIRASDLPKDHYLYDTDKIYTLESMTSISSVPLVGEHIHNLEGSKQKCCHITLPIEGFQGSQILNFEERGCTGFLDRLFQLCQFTSVRIEESFYIVLSFTLS